MKKVISLLLIAGLMISAPSVNVTADTRDITLRPTPGGYTLKDCYRMALKQSEIIAIDADQIHVADARFLQALAIMLPHASFMSTDSQSELNKNSALSAYGMNRNKSSEKKFNVTQTLFNGFKAFAAMKGSGTEKMQYREEKTRAEQLLLVDVSNAFYLLLEKRADIIALERIKKALKDRIVELRDREKLGRSRPSEVVNAKAELYTVEANIEVARSQEVVARQLLEFLIGGPVSEVNDIYNKPILVRNEEYYVAKANNRPDVKAAKFAWDVAKDTARVIDSDFLPSVNVDANYYTQRTGFSKGIDWDVMLSVDVPIFEGTDTIGRSKEYHLIADQAKLEFERLRRKTPYDIRDAYTKFNAAVSVQNYVIKALRAARLNFYLQKKDYTRSLVSNLDVLAAIKTLQESQRNYIQAVYEAKRLYWQLRVAVGDDAWECLNVTI